MAIWLDWARDQLAYHGASAFRRAPARNTRNYWRPNRRALASVKTAQLLASAEGPKQQAGEALSLPGLEWARQLEP